MGNNPTGMMWISQPVFMIRTIQLGYISEGARRLPPSSNHYGARAEGWLFSFSCLILLVARRLRTAGSALRFLPETEVGSCFVAKAAFADYAE